MSWLTDLRGIIGGLFCVYGVILTVAGVLDSPAELTKAMGVRINLWTGLAMLVIGAVFLCWTLARPLRADGSAPGSGDEDRG